MAPQPHINSHNHQHPTAAGAAYTSLFSPTLLTKRAGKIILRSFDFIFLLLLYLKYRHVLAILFDWAEKQNTVGRYAEGHVIALEFYWT